MMCSKEGIGVSASALLKPILGSSRAWIEICDKGLDLVRCSHFTNALSWPWQVETEN